MDINQINKFVKDINEEYIFDEQIHGGFGEVFKVHHSTLGYKRAIKTLDFNAATPDQYTIQNFQKECLVLAALGTGTNPNIVKIHNFEITKQPYFIDMEYVEGDSFAEYAKENYLDFNEVRKFIKNIGGALAYCHNYKDEDNDLKFIIHNDLHSANIIRRNADEEYVLLDFGLSMQDGQIIRSSKRNAGWCEFMSPERCKMEQTGTSEEATPAWDVYSLGCLIFLALTGRPPFALGVDCKRDIDVQSCHMQVDQYKPWDKIEKFHQEHYNKIKETKPSDKIGAYQEVPLWLKEIIAKCMDIDPQKRFRNAQELLDTFDNFDSQKSVPYDIYMKEVELHEHYEKKFNKLQGQYTQLEGVLGNITRNQRQSISRNWIVAIVVALAFASNCMKVTGEYDSTLEITSIILSILGALVLLGLVLYDTYKTGQFTNSSNKE